MVGNNKRQNKLDWKAQLPLSLWKNSDFSEPYIKHHIGFNGKVMAEEIFELL